MQGLSLEQAPPYKVPLFYYMIGISYLIVFSLLGIVYSFDLSSRFEFQAVALTHLFTLGFFTHIMFGSLFQMVPVIIGEAYRNVQTDSKIILLFLNLGIFSMVGYFLTQNTLLVYSGSLFLGVSVLFFSVYSICTLLRTTEKNAVVKTFLTSLLFLFLGGILGIFGLLQYSGTVHGTWVGDIHMYTMLFGWVFLLFAAVSYKVLPMFYVAKEYPLFIKKYLYVTVGVLLVLMLCFTVIGHKTQFILPLKFALAVVLSLFAIVSIVILKQRKRARKELTVNFFYFANSNLFAGAILWIMNIIFDCDTEFIFALLFGLGFVYGLINGMLYKIVPFLTWFHLSSKFVVEAEMSEVIVRKNMRLQSRLFFIAYGLFVISLFYKTVVFAAFGFFFLSSSILLYNIATGYLYHQEMIKKAFVHE